MSISDRQRWNSRYTQEECASFERPRGFLVQSALFLPHHGLALDAAMGLGGNAAFLLARGLRVIGVDISEVALRAARQRLPGLAAVQADLSHFYFPENTFELIVNFYYLERSLWPSYSSALKPGGILVFETLSIEMLSIHPEIDPLYLLKPGELRQAFPDLETISYRQEWITESGHRRPVASLVARRPDRE